jgi:hypothetical protein
MLLTVLALQFFGKDDEKKRGAQKPPGDRRTQISSAQLFDMCVGIVLIAWNFPSAVKAMNVDHIHLPVMLSAETVPCRNTLLSTQPGFRLIEIDDF